MSVVPTKKDTNNINPDTLFSSRAPNPPSNTASAYTPIENYIPSGKMVYNQKLLKTIERG